MRRLIEILAHCESGASTFPFGFVVDSDLRLIEIGRSLPAIIPEMRQGSLLNDVLMIQRPRLEETLSLELLKRNVGELLIFKSINNRELRAECFIHDDKIGFNSTPVLTGLNSFEEYGLSFSDFPIIDGVSDHVFNLSMQQQTLIEAERIAEELSVRNEELRKDAHTRLAEIRRREAMELEQARLHEELIIASREAGKAEIATGVLHNVGNVMNSVNVTADMLYQKLRKRVHGELEAAVQLLGEHRDDLPSFIQSEQGQHFLPFLSQLQANASDLMDEVQSLRSNIEHVNSVVAAQQAFATTAGVHSIINLAEVIDAAIQITSETFRRHKIAVVREYQINPEMLIDKQTMIQILVNLLRNAKHAIEDLSNAKTESNSLGDLETIERSVVVKIRPHSQHEVAIEVTDSGIGISSEDIEKVFQHGFTTRKQRGGHGFGLHYSYFAVEELGGKLEAHSNGLRQGATFLAILPINQLEAV